MSPGERWYDGILQELPTVLWVLLAMAVALELWALRALSEIRDPLMLLLGAILTRIRTPRAPS